MMGNVCYGSYEGLYCLHKAAMGSAREMRGNPPYNPNLPARAAAMSTELTAQRRIRQTCSSYHIVESFSEFTLFPCHSC